MKIVLNDWQDVQHFLASLSPELIINAHSGLRARVYQEAERMQAELGSTLAPAKKPELAQSDATTAIAADYGVVTHVSLTDSPPDPACAVQPAAGGLTSDERDAIAQDQALGGAPTDVDGVEHNVAWHSEPAKINADGRWKARRGRDADAYAKWIAPLQAIGSADESEPVATETHALPQDEPSVNVTLDGEPIQPEPTTVVGPDLTALVEASQEAAKDAPDGMQDLLLAGREFIGQHGTAKFEALKAAVAPTEDGKGKPLPVLVPGERRLLRACMDNYALYV